jgi:hypothetical protein
VKVVENWPKKRGFWCPERCGAAADERAAHRTPALVGPTARSALRTKSSKNRGKLAVSEPSTAERFADGKQLLNGCPGAV